MPEPVNDWALGSRKTKSKNAENQLVMKNRTQSWKILILWVITICGIVSAQATIHSYTVSFGAASGVTTSGTGSGTVELDDVSHMLTLQASWSGLTGNTTVSHIHMPTATPFSGNAGVVITPGNLVGFPAGVTFGTYSRTF